MRQAWSEDIESTSFCEGNRVGFPIIADPNFAIAGNYAPNGSFGIPRFAVIDRQMVIRAWGVNGDVSNLVDQLLSEPAPSVDWPMP